MPPCHLLSRLDIAVVYLAGRILFAAMLLICKYRRSLCLLFAYRRVLCRNYWALILGFCSQAFGIYCCMGRLAFFIPICIRSSSHCQSLGLGGEWAFASPHPSLIGFVQGHYLRNLSLYKVELIRSAISSTMFWSSVSWGKLGALRKVCTSSLR